MNQQIPLQFINPFTDFGFKKLFGEESSKEYLIDFLNSVFEEFIPKISQLHYHKNEQLGASEQDRNAIFDLYCKTSTGERFIIELQKVEQTYFRERTLFYSTFAVQEQAKKGIWDFKLMPIYCIGILNFTFNNDKNKYLHFGRILDIQTHEVLLNTLNFAYIECPKFNKEINKHSSNHDKWLYLFTHLASLNHIPQELAGKIFEDFFKQANILKLNTKELSEYNNSIKYYRDMHNIEQQNLEKGIQQGKYESQLDIAKNLKILNSLSIEQISQVTNIDIESIKNL